jgi:DNA-binding NtrC family response regulator
MQPGEASTAAGPPAVEPTGPAPRGRILVVDDEPAVRKILRRMLGREHEVVTATSGDEGKRMLGEDTAFDLILCDVTMSGVSGTDLHRWLAETHPALSRHLVFITGGAFTPRAIKYLRQVDNLRIQKPFDTVDLLGLVRELVGASQGRKREGCVRRCPETVEPDPV